MSLVEALLLALVQGLTEFLPVSSDGHLALAQLVLGQDAALGEDALLYDVVLHVATTLAVVVYFRRELWSLRAALGRGPTAPLARRVVLLVACASVATACIGFALKDAAERAYSSPGLVGLGFLGTTLALASTWRIARDSGGEEAGAWLEGLASLRVRDALLVGLAQGLAVWPGLSRSGTTIATALWLGVRPVAAARFSLLVLLPAVSGAFLLEALDAPRTAELPGGPSTWAAGFVLALAVGYFAIGWLVHVVRRARLPWFAAYTLALGVVLVVAGFLQR